MRCSAPARRRWTVRRGCGGQGIAAQAVSSPREANAGCGLSARFAEGDLPRARRVVAQAGYSAFAGFCRAGTGYLRGGF